MSNSEAQAKNYQDSKAKAKEELQQHIDDYLNVVNKMVTNQKTALIKSRILNSLLRPNIGKEDTKNLKAIRDSSNLAANVYKTISYLNFLGNSSDCSWFSLYPRNLDRLFRVDSPEYRAFTEWCQSCEKILQSCFENAKSGFYTNVFSNWADWFVQGCSCLRIDFHPRTGQTAEYNNELILFSNINIENLLLDMEEWGEITKVAYKFELTLEQALNRNQYNLSDLCISKEEEQSLRTNLSQDKRQHYKDKLYKFIDFTMSRPKFADWATNFYLGKSFIRMIICETTRKIIYLSEEDTLPYVVSRLFPSVENPYGVSSLWSSVKGFDFERSLHEAKAKNIAYHTAPIMMSTPGYSAQVLSKFGGQVPPGAILEAIDSQGRPLLMPMQFGGDLRLLEATYQQTYNELQTALMANDILPMNSAGMSATESLRLASQWYRRILPLIESRKQDFLAPMCQRCLYLLRDLGTLTASPIDGLVEGIDPINFIGIEFGGHLRNASQTQSLVDLDNCINMISKIGYAEIFNIDTIARTIASKFNIPMTFLKSKEQLQEEAKARAQQIQQQQAEEYMNKMTSTSS